MSREVARAGEKIRRTRQAAEEAIEAARLVALAAIENGESESAVARDMGVSRMTIRKWAGK